MTFLRPEWFWLLTLIAPLAIIYLLQGRRLERNVPSLRIWQKLEVRRGTPRGRIRLRRFLSFFLMVIALIGSTFAAAGAVIGELREEWWIVDASHSMAVADMTDLDSGQAMSRFAHVLQEWRSQPATPVVFGRWGDSGIAQQSTFPHGWKSLSPSGGPPNWSGILPVIAKEGREIRIWTDRPERVPESAGVVVYGVGSVEHRAVLREAFLQLSSDGWEVVGSLVLEGEGAVSVEVEAVRSDGTVNGSAPVDVAPGGESRFRLSGSNSPPEWVRVRGGEKFPIGSLLCVQPQDALIRSILHVGPPSSLLDAFYRSLGDLLDRSSGGRIDPEQISEAVQSAGQRTLLVRVDGGDDDVSLPQIRFHEAGEKTSVAKVRIDPRRALRPIPLGVEEVPVPVNRVNLPDGETILDSDSGPLAVLRNVQGVPVLEFGFGADSVTATQLETLPLLLRAFFFNIGRNSEFPRWAWPGQPISWESVPASIEAVEYAWRAEGTGFRRQIPATDSNLSLTLPERAGRVELDWGMGRQAVDVHLPVPGEIYVVAENPRRETDGSWPGQRRDITLWMLLIGFLAVLAEFFLSRRRRRNPEKAAGIGR